MANKRGRKGKNNDPDVIEEEKDMSDDSIFNVSK